MDNNILATIRTAKGFNRSVALLVILALVGLMLERVIYYSLQENDIIEPENVVEKINRLAPHEARRLGLPMPVQNQQRPVSDETQFAQTAQTIKEKLSALDNEYVDVDINQLSDDVAALRQHLQALDESIKSEFANTAEHIQKHQLADVIQQRHDEAVEKYNKEFNSLINKLAAIDSAKTLDAKKTKLIEAKDYLSKQQFKRSQQAFDPNNLPFNSVKPNPDNKPRIREQDFAAAGLFNHPQQKLAALGDFTFDKLPGATDPAYLAQTDEVVITDVIRAQAEALNYDPVQIYHWALNNIEWLPTWGSLQDSDITLGSKKGNSMDIASLLVALLRASKIPARYVHGTIDVPVDTFKNWAGGFTSIEAAMDFASSGGIPVTSIISGGQVTKVRMEHIWVEAAIDYNPSRGAKNRDADAWVQMDASFKQFDYLQGLDVAQIAGIDGEALAQNFIDSGTVNEAEGWVSGFDPALLETAQQQAQTALQDYITNNMTNPTVGDVIGGRKTIIKQYPVLPSSLQNRIVVVGKRYGAIPSALQQKMIFSMGRDVLGYPLNSITIPWVRLNNHKITLSFKPATTDDEQMLLSLLPEGDITDISQLPSSIPAYLINVIPELKVDGNIVKAGNTMTLGAEINFGFDTQLVGRGQIPKSYIIPAGSFLSVAAIAGSVSTSVLTDLQTRLADTRDKFLSANPTIVDTLTREDYLGDMFHAGSLGYYAQYIGLSNLTGLQSGGHFNLAGGTGSFGYEPDVDYFFGMPRSLNHGGIALNKPIINITGTNDVNAEAKKNYTLQIGMMSSALEHVTPEQMFTDANNPGEAISAIRALQKATEQGQRIYQITQQNMSSTLPSIYHDSATMGEIRNAVNAGKTVITHPNAIQVPGWRGAGYIIIDNDTGSGAYKIAGGGNGGFFIIAGFIALTLITLFPVFGLIFATSVGIWSFLFAAVSVFLGIMEAISFGNTILDVASADCSDSDKATTVSNQTFLYVVEMLASMALLGKAVGANAKWKTEFFEIADTVLVGTGSATASQLNYLSPCR